MPARVFVLPAAGGGGAAKVIAPDPNRPKRPIPVPRALSREELERTVIGQLWLAYLARERERASRDCARCGARHVCLKPAQQRERRRQRQRCKAIRARTRSPILRARLPGLRARPAQAPGLLQDVRPLARVPCVRARAAQVVGRVRAAAARTACFSAQNVRARAGTPPALGHRPGAQAGATQGRRRRLASSHVVSVPSNRPGVQLTAAA